MEKSVLIIAALLVASCASVKPMRNASAYDGAEARHYRYEMYRLDLDSMTEEFIPNNINDVEDCSDQASACYLAKGATQILALVVPKSCADLRVGEKFQRNGLVTEVIAKAYGSRTTYLLATRGRNRVVYEYSPKKGVTAIYWDAKLDILDIVELTRMDNRFPQQASSERRIVVFPKDAQSKAIAQCAE